MIRISKPIVREVDRKVFLVSYMSDNKSKTEVNPNGEEVFYATTKDYGQYLTNESSDCFVVGILLMAIKLGKILSAIQFLKNFIIILCIQ